MSLRNILIALVAVTAISLVAAATGLGSLLSSVPAEQSSAPSSVETLGTPTESPGVSGTPAAATPTVTPPGTLPAPTSTGVVASHQPFILLNPATARPGSSVGVSGSGFDPGTRIDFTLKRSQGDQGSNVGFVQADKGGSFGGFNLSLPDSFADGSFILVARQRDGKHEASAVGHLTANSPGVKLGTQVGKPGDSVKLSLSGFAPNELVKVYWNSLGSRPLETLQMDAGGGLLSGSLTVPFGAVGNNEFVFVGDKSDSPVTVPFLMLNLYPTVSVSSYAAKADTTLTFSGSGFGPGERVRVYLNSVQSVPVGIVQADSSGAFKNAVGFVIPFTLKGQNSFIFLGEQSLAPATVSFSVLPYTPYAEASTYGARPGTTVTFYGQGFARQEVVHVYVGRGQGNSGQEVTCALTDSNGSLLSGGSYTIPFDAQPGKLGFQLVGSKSEAEATATLQVMPPGGPAPAGAPEQSHQPFHCPYDGPAQGQESSATATPTGTPAAPAAVTPAIEPTLAPAISSQRSS